MKKLILLAALVFQGLAVAASETPAKDTAQVELSIDTVLTDKVTPGSAKEVLMNLDMTSFENFSTAGWGFDKETTFLEYMKLYYDYAQDPTRFIVEDKREASIYLIVKTKKDGYVGHVKEFSLFILTKPDTNNIFFACFYEYADSWYGGHYNQAAPLKLIKKGNIYQVVKQYTKNIDGCDFYRSF